MAKKEYSNLNRKELEERLRAYEESPLLPMYEVYQNQIIEFCQLQGQKINIKDEDAEKKIKIRLVAAEGQMKLLAALEDLRDKMTPFQLKQAEVMDIGFAEKMALMKKTADENKEKFNPYVEKTDG
jgi:hypothetical protein